MFWECLIERYMWKNKGFAFVLNNIICTVTNCVKKVTINQGCGYLVSITRNIGVKLQLVQIWARVSASAHLKGNAQMPIAWGTPSWDGLMTGSDWLKSLMGFMSESMSAKSNTTRHEITVWYKVMLEIIAYTRSSTYRLCRSGSLNRDGAVISSLMITDWNPNRRRVRDAKLCYTMATVEKIHDIMFLNNNRATSK